jgi:hypothetical protein
MVTRYRGPARYTGVELVSADRRNAWQCVAVHAERDLARPGRV